MTPPGPDRDHHAEIRIPKRRQQQFDPLRLHLLYVYSIKRDRFRLRPSLDARSTRRERLASDARERATRPAAARCVTCREIAFMATGIPTACAISTASVSVFARRPLATGSPARARRLWHRSSVMTSFGPTAGRAAAQSNFASAAGSLDGREVLRVGGEPADRANGRASIPDRGASRRIGTLRAPRQAQEARRRGQALDIASRNAAIDSASSASPRDIGPSWRRTVPIPGSAAIMSSTRGKLVEPLRIEIGLRRKVDRISGRSERRDDSLERRPGSRAERRHREASPIALVRR